jgi:hypothetical protein
MSSTFGYEDAPEPLTDSERKQLKRMFSDYWEVPGEWKTSMRMDLERDPPIFGKQVLGGQTLTPGAGTIYNIHVNAAANLALEKLSSTGRIGASGIDVQSGGLVVEGGLALGPTTPPAAGAIKFGDGTIQSTAGAGGGGGIPPTIVDAKGDMIVATGPDVVARVPVGGDGQVWTADSAQAVGGRWTSPSTVAGVVATTVAGLGVGIDGKVGLLRIGPSPYDYLSVVYDATAAKWIGPEWAAWRGGSRSGDASWAFLTGTHFPWFAYKTFYNAGLRLQVRAFAQLNDAFFAVGSGGANVGENTTLDATNRCANIGVYDGGGGGIYDSDWVDFNALVTARDFMTLRGLYNSGEPFGDGPQVADGNTILARWVSA